MPTMTFFFESAIYPVVPAFRCAESLRQTLSHHGRGQIAHTHYRTQAILSFSQFFPSKRRDSLRFSSLLS